MTSKSLGFLGGLALFCIAGIAFAQTVAYPAYPSYVPPSYSCPQLSYNLYRGLSDYHTGGEVTRLQQFLASRGYYQAVTGYFGNQTYANVAQFQREQSVYPITGGVGPLTRAAIQRVCGGNPNPQPTSGVFYLNSPFSLAVGQSAKEYQGQLDVTLVSLNTGVTWFPWSSQNPTSAKVTLGQSCAPGTYCLAIWYPTQTYDLTIGQSVTFQGYTVMLSGLAGNTATFTVAKGAVASAPTISSVSPTQGPVGTQVTVYGSGFIQGSTLYFGSGVVQSPSISSDGTRITFTVPSYLNAACYYTQPYCLTAAQQVTPGNYNLYVTNQNGQSGTYTFTVTQSCAGCVGGLTVTSPTQGQTVARGSVLPITWGYPITPGSASTIVDLYTAQGTKVGTIAVQSNTTSGSYNWVIPTPGTICTQQYPNGLCGMSLSGQYYIKVSAVSGSGFDANPTTYASGQSGTFTIY